MRCAECYWAVLNSAVSIDMVCCNIKSPNYNKILGKEGNERFECNCGESQEAVDYRTMSPWDFASKYYGQR